MIIRDINNNRYRLVKTRLTSLPNNEGIPEYYIKFSEIKYNDTVSFKGPFKCTSVQLWQGDYGPGQYIRVPLYKNGIGCRKFNKKTMRLINKAIKAYQRRTKTKAATA